MGGLFRISSATSEQRIMNRLSRNQRTMSRARERLSSGQRINQAGDDAAGLTISTRLESQIRGLDQSIDNAQDAISMLRTADGAMEKIQANVQRMRELAVQSANDSLTDSDRENIEAEIDQLLEDIDDIAERATFNDRPLLVNEFQPEEEDANIQSLANRVFNASFEDPKDPNDPDDMEAAYWDDLRGMAWWGGEYRIRDLAAHGNYAVRFLDPAGPDSRTTTSHRFDVEGGAGVAMGVSARLVADDEDAGDLNTDVDAAYDPENSEINFRVRVYDEDDNELDTISPAACNFSQIGAYEHFYCSEEWGYDEEAGEFGYVPIELPEEADSARLEIEAGEHDTSVNRDIMIDRAFVTQTGHGNLDFHLGANRDELINISNEDLPAVTSSTMGIGGLSVMTRKDANESLMYLEEALDKLSTARATVGAAQNRLEGAVDYMMIQRQEAEDSRSQIRDADLAEETTNRLRSDILTQSATSLLGQVPEQAAVALRLLQN